MSKQYVGIRRVSAATAKDVRANRYGYSFWLGWLAVGAAGEVYALKTGRMAPLTRFLVFVTGYEQPWEKLGETALLALGLVGWRHVSSYDG